MKICYLLLLILILPVFSKAQKDSVPDLSLNDKEAEAWTQMRGNWLATGYKLYLKQHHHNISCAACDGVVMSVEFCVDSTGRLRNHKVMTGFECGETFTPAHEKEFLTYFYRKEFPALLRNKRFQVNLGRNLKC